MFKKIMSGGSKAKTGKQRTVSAPSSSKQTVEKNETEINETVAHSSMNKAKRQLFQFDLPTTDLGFQDLLKSYEEGNRFQYVALTGSNDETYESRIRRVLTFQFSNDKKGMPKFTIPKIKLIENTHQFNLGQIIGKRKDFKDYIRLSSVVGVFIPLISSFFEFSTVSFTLHDTRKQSKTAVQTARYNSNLQSKVEMSLDYCIPKTSASKIILDVGLEQATLMPGEEWGVLQMVINLETSDSPYVTNLKEVVSVVGMPPSLLETYKSNPNYIDTTITESQKKTVRDIFESGDIADETEPLKEDLKPINYAKSSVGLRKKGPKMDKPFGEGWKHLDGLRKPLEKYDDASVDPDSEGDLEINTSEARRRLKAKQPAVEQTDPTSSDSDNEIPPVIEKALKGVRFNELQV